MKNVILLVLTALVILFATSTWYFWRKGEPDIPVASRLQLRRVANGNPLSVLATRNGVRSELADTVEPRPASHLGPLSDPAFALIRKAEDRRSVWRQYGEAIKSLHLSAGQTGRLVNLMVERNEAHLDALDVAMTAKLPQSEIQLALQAAIDPINTQIDTLLGPDGTKQFQAAQRLQSAELEVDQGVGLDFEASGYPLNSDQREKLSRVVAELQTMPIEPGQIQVSSPASLDVWKQPSAQRRVFYLPTKW